MIGLLLKILLTAVLFIILSFVIPGFKCNDMGSALKASFGFAIISNFFIESNKTLIIVTIVYAISSIAMNAAFDAFFK